MALVSSVSDRQGMTKKAMMDQLTTWFVHQDHAIQAAVLGREQKAGAPGAGLMFIRKLARNGD